MQIDHLAVTCGDLDTGADAVAGLLGVVPRPGGAHTRYGTHNRLLRLGPGEYLEVIAPDPSAPAPEGPRWFGLDRAGAPRLGNWILRTDDLEGARARLPDCGAAVPMRRGDLTWTITVPDDGALPLGGGLPTLLSWDGAAQPGQGAHPADRLPDDGLRLERLEVHHPQARSIAARLGLDDPRVVFVTAPAPALRARIGTPAGARWLE